MEIAILVISILIIAIVLLQSGKAEDAAQIMTGGSENLFKNRKERGGELFITRATALLGVAFFVLCILVQMQ